MIALVTNREDLTADWLIVELTRRRVPFTRINTEDFPAAMRLRWSIDDATLELNGTEIRSSTLTAIWWRRPVVPDFRDDQRTAAEAEWAVTESLAAFEGFLRNSAAHWVNDPIENKRAEGKPHQLRRASALGLVVPETLITNDPDALRVFAAKHQGVVCKAIDRGVVPSADSTRVFFTSRVAPGELDPLDDFGPEPYLFQELIQKAYDVRVTVIGDAAFACRIESQDGPDTRVDWRRGDRELRHAPEELPEDVETACLELAAGFGLRFAPIDLARRPDGEYVFFELNPNGQWAWIEQYTALPLRAALCQELMHV